MSSLNAEWDSYYNLYYKLRYNDDTKVWERLYMPANWQPSSASPTTPTPLARTRTDSLSTVTPHGYNMNYSFAIASPGTAAGAADSQPTVSHGRYPSYRGTQSHAGQQPYGGQQDYGMTPGYFSSNTHPQPNVNNSQNPYAHNAQPEYVHNPPSSTYNNSQPVTHQRNASLGLLPRGTGRRIEGTYRGPSTSHFEEVDHAYYVRPKAFFFEGRVFAVIMNETAGTNPFPSNAPTDYNTSKSINAVRWRDNYVYTNVRRFIVVRSKREFCYACPIFTYSGRATTKSGVRPAEHGIAYSWNKTPRLVDGEKDITKASIGVVMASGESDLTDASRIYYGIHHPIQYNVKVKEIGYVPQTHIPTLIGNWKEEAENEDTQSAEVTRNAEVPQEEIERAAAGEEVDNDEFGPPLLSMR